VSEEFVLHDALEPAAIRGRDGLREYIEVTREAFPDLSTSIERVVTDEDTVAVQFRFRGTHEGAIPGLNVEPAGATVEMVGMEFNRIEDGMLVETHLLYDTLGFVRQLGAIPVEGPGSSE